MPFDREPKRDAVEVGRLDLHMSTLAPASTAVDVATVNFTLLDANGNVVKERGGHELLQHLSASQKTTLFNIMSALRTKIKSEAV